METNVVRVEACSSRNLLILEKMLMPFCGNRGSKLEHWIVIQNAPVHLDVGVRRNGCNGQEEWVVGPNSFIEEVVGFLSKHVCHIIAFITFRGLSSVLKCTI